MINKWNIFIGLCETMLKIIYFNCNQNIDRLNSNQHFGQHAINFLWNTPSAASKAQQYFILILWSWNFQSRVICTSISAKIIKEKPNFIISPEIENFVLFPNYIKQLEYYRLPKRTSSFLTTQKIPATSKTKTQPYAHFIVFVPKVVAYQIKTVMYLNVMPFWSRNRTQTQLIVKTHPLPNITEEILFFQMCHLSDMTKFLLKFRSYLYR